LRAERPLLSGIRKLVLHAGDASTGEAFRGAAPFRFCASVRLVSYVRNVRSNRPRSDTA
jgi:hypothetical protein